MRICAVLLLASATAALAQQQPDAGRILREQERPLPAQPQPRAPGTTIDEPARPALKPAATPRFVLREIRFSGNTAFAGTELLPLVAEYVGREIGFEELQAAAARITRHYRENGYPVARAYLPEQAIENGVVEIALLEGRYGRVSFSNRSRVKDEVVRQHLEGLEGRALTQRELERRMLLLNDLAGVGEARSSVRAGQRRGESDLTVALAESTWATGSVELDNYGNRFTGQSRLTGEAKLLSPLGLGDRLDVRYTHGFDDLGYGRVAYQLPLGGDGWRVGGALSRSEYKLGKTFAPLGASGDATSASAQVSYPLVRSFAFNLYAQGTAERRDLQDRTASTGSITDKRLDVAGLGLSGDATHGEGITAFSLVASSGRLDIESAAARTTDDVTARSNGRYAKTNWSLYRLQSLGERTNLVLSLSGQWASKNLDSSEKFSLGGAYGVRGYPSGEAVGDSGHVGTVELRHAIPVEIGILQPFVFADAGRVTVNRNPFAATANAASRTAAGAGLAWTKPGDFQLKFTWARRGSHAATSDTDHRSRAWVTLAKYF